MKISFYLLFISIALLSACNKSMSRPAPKGLWNLVQKNEAIGPEDHILTPSKDSSVVLLLNPNGIYVSKLNGGIISQGSYSITTDTSYYNEQVLQLNNFKTTGLFNLFTLYQVGANNQLVSEFDGLYMKISNDTLTLSSPITPGGFISYTFLKIL